MKLRFAPSPTGFLHVGNARTLLLNWLYARHHGAEFILRFDDTDAERCKEEYVFAIKEDIKWLGLDYDLLIQQSQRESLYYKSIEYLKKHKLIYPCYETKQELDIKRKYQLSSGNPPIYDRTGLYLTNKQQEDLRKQGKKPHWRFKLEPKDIIWPDLCHGLISINCATFSDPIIIRENGAPIFTLSGIIDDIELEISHVVRGDDHISNTAIQIQIMQALGNDINKIKFAHLPLITDNDGSNLSKRFDSLSLRAIKEKNYESMSVINYLSQLGNPNSSDILHSVQDLINKFSLVDFGKSSPKFLLKDMDRFNAKFIRSVAYEQIKKRLTEVYHTEIDYQFWHTIRNNITNISDVEIYREVCFGIINPQIEDESYLTQVLAVMPPEPWSDKTWYTWIDQIKIATGRKDKELFMPIRKAVTGREHGPEMSKLLTLIGYAKVYKRLSGEIA